MRDIGHARCQRPVRGREFLLQKYFPIIMTLTKLLLSYVRRAQAHVGINQRYGHHQGYRIPRAPSS